MSACVVPNVVICITSGSMDSVPTGVACSMPYPTYPPRALPSGFQSSVCTRYQPPPAKIICRQPFELIAVRNPPVNCLTRLTPIMPSDMTDAIWYAHSKMKLLSGNGARSVRPVTLLLGVIVLGPQSSASTSTILQNAQWSLLWPDGGYEMTCRLYPLQRLRRSLHKKWLP